MSEEEAAAPNIEDRIVSALGEDIEEAPAETEEEEAPVVEGDDDSGDDDSEIIASTVEIEIDGETLLVPEKYKDHFLRQDDYTKKTQTLAEQRREVELRQTQVETVQSEQKFVGEIQPELNNIGYLDAHIAQLTQSLQSNVNSLTSEQMFKQKIELDGYKDQRQVIADGLQLKYKEFEEAQKQSYEELLVQGAQVLKTAIPDWNEDKQKEVRDYALGEGFAQQEVLSITDPRHVKVLWKAAQFDKIQKGTASAVEKVAAAPVIAAKARASKMDTGTRSKLDYKNTMKRKNLTKGQREAAQLDRISDIFS